VDDAIVEQHLPVQPARTAAGGQLMPLSEAEDAGTTRLALQAAVQLTVEFHDGVWYVGLAPDTDPDIPQLAAGAAGATSDFSRRHRATRGRDRPHVRALRGDGGSHAGKRGGDDQNLCDFDAGSEVRSVVHEGILPSTRMGKRSITTPSVSAKNWNGWVCLIAVARWCLAM